MVIHFILVTLKYITSLDEKHLDFLEWFARDEEDSKARGLDVFSKIKALAKTLKHVASNYRSMYAFGYHLWAKIAKTSMLTYNLEVVATFKRPCQSNKRDHRIVVAA